jgi:exodeoxyribonuclease III
MANRKLEAQLALPLDPVAVLPRVQKDINTALLIATWNVNSIRARLDLVVGWLDREKPDVVFLQETKVTNDLFPMEPFKRLGYEVACFGQRQYNGVAILSRSSIVEPSFGLSTPSDHEARTIAATILGIRMINVYAPNAVSIADARFTQKVQWLKTLAEYIEKQQNQYHELLLCGDFNVIPFDFDAHDVSFWLYRTFVHADVRNALSNVTSERLVDLHIHKNGHVSAFTWWDYRNQAFSSNDGIRIDHLYASKDLAARCTDVWVDVKTRREKSASDHAPVLARFAFDRRQ